MRSRAGGHAREKIREEQQLLVGTHRTAVREVCKHDASFLSTREIAHGDVVGVALETEPPEVLPGVLVVHVEHAPQVSVR